MEKARSSYPSDLTDGQWAVLVTLIGMNAGAGRPLKHDLREDRECNLVCGTHRYSMAFHAP